MKHQPKISLQLAAEELGISIERAKYLTETGDLTIHMPATNRADRMYKPDGSYSNKAPKSYLVRPPVCWKGDCLTVLNVAISYENASFPEQRKHLIKLNEVWVDRESIHQYKRETIRPKNLEHILSEANNEAKTYAQKLKAKGTISDEIIAFLTRHQFGENSFDAVELIAWLEIKFKGEKLSLKGRKLIHNGKNQLKKMYDAGLIDELKEIGFTDFSALD